MVADGFTVELVKNIPTIIRAFVARYPSAGAQPIQDFYQRQEEIAPYWKTLQAKAKEGDEVAVERIMAIGGDFMMEKIDGLKNALNVASTIVKRIQGNKKHAPGGT